MGIVNLCVDLASSFPGSEFNCTYIGQARQTYPILGGPWQFTGLKVLFNISLAPDTTAHLHGNKKGGLNVMSDRCNIKDNVFGSF